MGRAWWSKLVMLIFFVGLSVVYVIPTLTNLNPETSKFPFKQKINLGLDLQGGLYMVLGVDFNKVFQDYVDRQGQVLEQSLKTKDVATTSVKLVKEGFPIDDPRVVISFPPASRDKIREQVKDYRIFRLTQEKEGLVELGLSTETRNEIRDRTLNQSIEVIRNRIDEFGVAEPSITSQGTDRVVVELPGVKDVNRAKDLIGRTARLEFKMVDDKAMDPGQVAALVDSIEKEQKLSYKEGQKFSEYVGKLNEFAKSKIPPGHEIAFERTHPAPGQTESAGRIPFLIFSKAEVTGDDLQDASVAINPDDNRPVVSFTLNPRGAKLFGDLTAASIGHRLAIVLDNIIHSAPVIQGAIPGGHGQITLGQGDGEKVMKEAKDLAIVLRAGALPAQLEFQEQRVIGPTLGADSIKDGAKAGIVGCALIFVFMIFYYKVSGLVAVISLIFNALFLFATLVGMEATLTLPGMAGIALTIGMAVDSNVIIFERIRDELSEGKAVAAAIQAGFQKAFSAIFDANITHGIIALILMTYGTGPIRGFAVALLIGIVTTLFCAITVCKLFFDGYIGFSKSEPSKLSI